MTQITSMAILLIVILGVGKLILSLKHNSNQTKSNQIHSFRQNIKNIKNPKAK